MLVDGRSNVHPHSTESPLEIYLGSTQVLFLLYSLVAW
jgi:hypothetical protein